MIPYRYAFHFGLFPFSGFQRRGLKLFTDQRPEVAIVSNSGLFLSLAAFNIHGRAAHRHLKMIVPPFWMDNTHSDYDGLSWGQTTEGLPWYVKQEFLKLYPNFSQQEFITWKQYKELRQFTLGELKKREIDLYFGLPLITPQSTQYRIQVGDEQFRMPLDTYFYNSFRVPRVTHQIKGFPERSHTDIYRLPRNQVPDSMIIAGGGRSTVWLAQHFPEKRFACIKYRYSDYPLLRGEALPSNLFTYMVEDFTEKNRFKTWTAMKGKDQLSIIVDLEARQRHFAGSFYAAIGLIPNESITSMICRDNLLVYPYSDALEWIAPEDIPTGSLMEATLRWAFATDNMQWAFEINCFHHGYYSHFMKDFLIKRHIPVDQRFFEYLKKEIVKSYYEQAGGVLASLPPDNDAIEIYRKCYKDVYGDEKNADLLAEILKEHIKQRYNFYVNESNLYDVVPSM